VLPVATDGATELGADAPASDLSFRYGLGEVELAVPELMAEQPDVAWAVAEAVGYKRGWEPLDEGGTQGLVAALPVEDGADEERSVAHAGRYIS
jgi:hypothetical protein